MKIADLKQPYRRMAEYLAEKNTYTRFKNKEILNDAFDWYQTNVIFWLDIADGYYPPITEEIKQYFPADFDFSEKEIENISINEKYTQLAKDGKFDQLPDTCEFSDPVNLQVWDNELMEPVDTYVLGKFKGLYVTEANLCWKYAKTITKIK